MTYVCENTYNYINLNYSDVIVPKIVSVELDDDFVSENASIIGNTIDAFLELPENNYSKILSRAISRYDITKTDLIHAIRLMSNQSLTNDLEGVISEINDKELVQTFEYYMKLCLVSYGKWFYIKGEKEDNIFKRLLSMGSKAEEIDWLFAEKHCKLTRDMFISFQWESEPFNPAHYIVVLDDIKTITVVNRGSLSKNDVIIDLSAKPLLYSFNNVDGYTHAGIYKSSLNKLKQILPILKSLRIKYPSYKIVFTGHSLGGGISQLQTLEIHKHFPDWPIHCYAFAPALVLSENIATNSLTKQLLDSIIVNNDLVPRLSYRSVLKCMQYANDVKQILSDTSVLRLRSKEKALRLKRAFNNYYDSTRIKEDDSLVPGGNTYHIKTQIENGKKVNKCYLRENGVFDWIFFQSGSANDHMPDGYEINMTKAVQAYK